MSFNMIICAGEHSKTSDFIRDQQSREEAERSPRN